MLFIYLDLLDSWRPLLSPLRLRVPLFRRGLEVLESKVYFYSNRLADKTTKCGTVQESVKVFADLHRFFSFANENALRPFSGQDDLGKS